MYEVETVRTDRTARWSETVTAFQGTLRFSYPDPGRFDAVATRQRSGRFQLVTWHIGQEQTISRAREADADFRLLLPLSGPADLRVGRADHRLTTGAGVLIGPTDPYDLRLPPGSRGLVLTLPRTETDAADGPHRILPLDRAPGRLLRLVLTTLVADRAELDRRSFDTVCRQATELVPLVTDDREAVPEADLAAEIRFLVRRHCTDPDLTGAAVARHVGWSLRQVQAVLRRAGTTPSRLIREARLERALDLLAGPGTVTEVAHAAGFRSIDALEKALRRRHGRTPSDFRRS
jgi:AraC-like DNA-binding protein